MILNIRKSTFSLGLLVVTNLVLLVGCEGCGKSETQKLKDEENVLINEENVLINTTSNKLGLTKEQKEALKEKIRNLKDNTDAKENLKLVILGLTEEQKNFHDRLITLKKLKPEDKKLAEQAMLLEFNKEVQTITNGASIKNIDDLIPCVDLLLLLLQNMEKQLNLEGKSKK